MDSFLISKGSKERASLKLRFSGRNEYVKDMRMYRKASESWLKLGSNPPVCGSSSAD